MIDVLFVLGSGSKWDNNELRYALRSIEKYAQNVGRVFVTGEDPKFLSKEVIYNYCVDPGCPPYNHIYKVLHTIKNTDISENFLINYDDNFFIQSVDIEKYPYYYKSTLPFIIRGRSGYRLGLLNTKTILDKYKKPHLNFEVHCPMIYNREKFLSLQYIWEQAQGMQYGLNARSIYCNMLDIPGEFMGDRKLKTTTNKAEALKAIEGRHVFSIHDRSIRMGVAELLAEEFPNKSRYEI